jgi:hypothetical protein
MTRVVLILAALSALALSACGGSGDQPSDSAAGGASQRSSDYIVPSNDKISNDDSPSAAQHPADEENDEVSPTGAGVEDPCRLVSADEASTILGEGVRTSVGSQGPTCIYLPKGSQPQMTVSIEETSLQSLRSHAARATRVAVGRSAGWCLAYGSTSVAVSVAEGSVLRVTGPCSMAARFAARALGRVSPS